MVDTVVVIVPAYNAGKTIEKVFARIPQQAKERIRRYVVVDDGSTDDTSEAVNRLQENWEGLELIRHSKNRGYGEAEKTLLDRAVELGADVTVLLHSDGQYSPEKIPELLVPFDEDAAEIVQGSRMRGGNALGTMPLYKFLANKGLTWIENRTFGLGLAEYHSGYMLYAKSAIEAIPYHGLSGSFDFDLEMLVMAKVQGLRVVDLPVPTIYADEKSHLDPIRYGFDVLRVVRDYKRGKSHSLCDGSLSPAGTGASRRGGEPVAPAETPRW
jgi:glycosyltransferase involved in cell wall biosynthesis